MKSNRRATCAFLVIAMVCCLGIRAHGQDDKPKAPDMAAMMKKWMATVRPGPEHKALAELVGTWDVNIKMWMGGPGSQPSVTKATSELVAILDGRFVQETMTGEFLMPDTSGAMKPIPYKSQSTIGYDKFQNMYVGTLMSNLSTAMLSCRGGRPPGSNVITLYGQMDEPMLDVIGRTVKYVLTIKDKDHTTLEIFDLLAGENHKVLEYEYTRKK